MFFSAGYVAYFFGGFLGLSDGNDYAGLARSIVRGEGFSLGHLYPLALVFNSNIPQPNNIWAPAYPVYLAGWFFIFGADDTSVLAAAIAIMWLLILATYYLGRKIAGEFGGILATALVGLNQSVLEVSLEGSPEILTAVLLAFSVLLLYCKKNSLNLLLSAVIFGLAVMSRYQIIAVAVPMFIFLPDRGYRAAVIWSAVVLATLSPWLIRNALELGNPFFTLQTYGEFTKGMGHLKYYYFNYRSFTPMTFWQAALNFPFYVFKKFGAGLVFFSLNFPAVINYFGVVPLAYGLRKTFHSGTPEGRFIGLTAVSCAIIILLSSFDGHHWRHLINLSPLISISVVIGLGRMFENLHFFKRKLAASLLVCLLFFPARFPFQEMELWHNARAVNESKAVYEMIAVETDPEDVVVSDVSDGVWWYSDRLSVWMPVIYDDLFRAMDIVKSDFIYLEDTSKYYSGLSDGELYDFHSRMSMVKGVPGRWGLFKRYDGTTIMERENQI